ncbi:MAG: hypothetical protein IPK97_03170 [Ahniella sp.]|nr:hypothetical protein [Ahniella sp.]
MIERSLEMAQLAAEVDRQRRQYAKRPRRKFISANTREYAYASYYARLGRQNRANRRLNFPEEAAPENHRASRRHAAVRRDGTSESVKSITQWPRSSTRLPSASSETGAPFAPLPQSDEQIDVLHITRTVQFLTGSVVRASEAGKLRRFLLACLLVVLLPCLCRIGIDARSIAPSG